MFLYSPVKIAEKVSNKLNFKTADRYDQIFAIKQEILSIGTVPNTLLATDREFIDDTLDILYYRYSFNA
jgi:hypothetical protein|tara:strand:+ start:167 stop:373 length:207 start_codon:yes stop_codon:yes gene_type:complete